MENQRGPERNPELDAFARQLVESIREASRQESERLAREFARTVDEKLDRLEARQDAKIEGMRLELRSDLLDIKEEQREQRKILSQHSTEIAGIKKQLDAGEQRFERLERQQSAIDAAGQTNRVRIAEIAASLGKALGTGAAGGGVVIAISRMLS